MRVGGVVVSGNDAIVMTISTLLHPNLLDNTKLRFL